MKPYTVVIQLDTWDDWTIYHIDADDPRDAVRRALIEDGFGPEDVDGRLAERIVNVSVLEGHSIAVFSTGDLS